MRVFKGIIGLLVLMLLATSCFRVEANIVVEDDGALSVDLLSAINADTVTSVVGDFDELGVDPAEIGSPDEICEGFNSDTGNDFPEGAVITPFNEDGFCGQRVFVQYPASMDQGANISEVLDGDTPTVLRKEGENWIFDTGLDTDDLTEGTDGVPDFLADALFEQASFKLSVRLPGKPIEGQNNATSIDGNTFTWDIDFLNPPDRLFAQTEPGTPGGGSGGTNWLLIGLVIAGLLVAGALIWTLMKNRTKTAASDGPAPYVPPGAEGAQPGAAAPVAAAPAEATSVAASEPVKPRSTTPEGQRETVVMGASDADAAPAPVYDEAIGAWVIDDPVRGRLQHNPETDTWHRVQ